MVPGAFPLHHSHWIGLSDPNRSNLYLAGKLEVGRFGFGVGNYEEGVGVSCR